MDPLLWSVLLLALGAGLIILEVFVPSGGVLGVLAAVAIVAAICVAFSGGPILGTSVLVAATILIPLLLAGVVKWWPQTPLGRLILLPIRSGRDVLPDTERTRERESLVGRYGRAKTKMLPSGAIVVGGRTYDAVSQGMAIDPGQPIKVVAVRTYQLIVRPAEEHELLAEESPPRTAEEELLARPLDDLGLEPLDDPLA
ncbi:MAG: NfeD family protein [Pirellulaceae bacterium]|nr:NfeD family protein [Pirellulaceae bacterium]